MEAMRNSTSPRNVEDALRRKRQVADEVTRLQTALKDPTPVDDHGQIILDRRLRAEFRQATKQKLDQLYIEARALKDWLRLHASHKPSEYEMLGRAYRLLSELPDEHPLGAEAEALLSDIEMHVPHAFLACARGAA